MPKNTAVFALCASRGILEDAVESLRAAGFRNTDISILFSENPGTKDLAHVKATKAPEGTATGAVSGAILGGALGWLLGIGAIAIPEMGPFVAAGPIVAALAGAGAGGTIGGIAGALIGFGLPEYEAKRYEGRVRKGGILLSVHCDDAEWTRRAKDILQITGAESIATTSEAAADFAKSDKPLPRRTVASSPISSILGPEEKIVGEPEAESSERLHNH